MKKNGAEISLQLAADNRKSEIGLLWSRSLYFWGLITVSLTSFGLALGSGHKTFAVFAACFGFLCSLSWSLANRSSKYWQTVWEKKVEQVERDALLKPIFPRSTNPIISQRAFWGPKQYSPSKLIIAVSDFSIVGWIVLVIGTLAFRLTQQFPVLQVPAAIIGNVLGIALTIAGAVILLLWCRSGEPISVRCARRVLRRYAYRTLRGLAHGNSN